jgi:hypothetical protein
MSNQDWKTQPRVSPCKTCDILIFWNSPLQKERGENKPYNLSGTAPHVHHDANEKHVSDEAKALKAQNIQPSAQAAPNSRVSNPISSTYNQQQLTDTIVAMTHEVTDLKNQIEYLHAQNAEMYTLIREWIQYNPISSSHSKFITDMFKERDELLRHFGPVPADELKSMNSDNVNPLPSQ